MRLKKKQTNFWGKFQKLSFKRYFCVVLILNLKIYFSCDHFSQRLPFGRLKIAISVNLRQITRDMVRATNAQAEIDSVLEIVPNWLKEAIIDLLHLPELICY